MNARLLLFLSAIALATPATIHAADGSDVFAANCVPCHGPDGKARTPAGRKLHAADLTKSKLADADIEKQIAEGTKDAKGKERMPSFNARLSPAEIAALVAYVKTLRH